jgi:hypothetical protein
MGDAADKSFSLASGTPAGRVHISASLSLSEKSFIQQGGTIFAMHQRITAYSYHIFIVERV